MTGAQLQEWAESLNLTNAQAATHLGVTTDYFVKMTKQETIKVSYALACRAVYQRLKPWPSRG